MPSGFGIKGDYEMDVSGVVKDDSNMTGIAMITGAPRLTKRANL